MTRRSLLLPGLIVALYVTWPYATLVQLRQDLRDHNVQALQQDIDWNSVRAGLKQQATESFDAPPAATKISAVVGDDLPPFGAGFNGPASFEVKLRPAQESPKDPPISIDFALVRNGWRLDWKVIHVSMPPSMMQPTKST
jgi:hypothetical protein